MKAVIFTILLFLANSGVKGQFIEWENTIGGNTADNLFSIIQTMDGGYLLAGSSSSDSLFDKNEESIIIDYWIVKIDALGAIQWQNTIQGQSHDYPMAGLLQLSDGGFLIGGYSRSDSAYDKTENSIGREDFWILKLDILGNILWQNTIGGDSTDYLISMVSTPDDGFILGGYSRSGISGDKTEICQGDYDYWIVKVDSLGIVQWQNTIGGNMHDELQSVSVTSDGGYILGGFSESGISGDKTENAHGNAPVDYTDYWVVKVDSSGIIEWQNTIGGDRDDKLYDVYQTNDGGYILGGSSRSEISGDKTENEMGYDYWVIKIDSTGNLIWQNSIGGNDGDFLVAIAPTFDGGSILGGYSGSEVSGDKTENSSLTYADYWIVKIDSNGNIEWQNTIGGNYEDWLTSISQTRDGGYIVGGRSASGISGDKSEPNFGSTDYWIVKLDGSCNFIQGMAFADINSDTIFDSSEIPIPYKKIVELNSGSFAFTNTYGNYNLIVPDSGYFELAPEPLNYFNSVPFSHSCTFNTFQSTDSLNDFALQQSGVHNDLCISISPLSSFVSGFSASYSIDYFNQGSTTLIPVIVFYPDSNLTFVNASLNPTLVTSDSIVFNSGSLMPFQSGQIIIEVTVDSGLTIGTLINSHATVYPIAGDVNPGCNQSNWEILVTGSFDPNDILVSRPTVNETELINPPWIEYIIRFQNTGNETAYFINIDNPIPSTLQLNELEVMATSHSCNISFQPYDSIMKFSFLNIMLPDSNINEPLSHGYIRYRIKPINSLTMGDSILNYARIWFDYNAPVMTNTAVTEVISTNAITEIQNELISLFPNPASSEITISFKSRENRQVLEIYNCFGQLVSEKKSFLYNEDKESTLINISSFPAGLYYIKIIGTNSYCQKFIKL